MPYSEEDKIKILYEKSLGDIRILTGRIELVAIEIKAVAEIISNMKGNIPNGQSDNFLIGQVREIKEALLFKQQNASVLSVDKQAEQLGLVLFVPNRNRCTIIGMMVGEDYRAALIKFTPSQAVELPFNELADGQDRPEIVDTVKMVFKAGVLKVAIARSGVRGGRHSQTIA